MRLISIAAAARLLVRCATASAVRIALAASFTTPHPAVALPGAADAPVARFAPAALTAGATTDNGGACEMRAAACDLVGVVGPGWG